MKNIDLGKTIQILANLGVIVGIVALVVELQLSGTRGKMKKIDIGQPCA